MPLSSHIQDQLDSALMQRMLDVDGEDITYNNKTIKAVVTDNTINVFEDEAYHRETREFQVTAFLNDFSPPPKSASKPYPVIRGVKCSIDELKINHGWCFFKALEI